MAPMQEGDPSPEVLVRNSPDSARFKQGWRFIFNDPTFGGSCPSVPRRLKRPSIEWNSSPVLEDLPAELTDMLEATRGGSSAPSPAPDILAAGSGAKGAAVLKKQGSKADSNASSGFGDDSEDEAPKKKKNSIVSSGFGDDSEDEAQKKRKSSLASSASGFSDVSKKGETSPSNGRSTGRSGPSPPPGGPARASRRAETIAPPEKKESEEGDDHDSDLLSNPFASSDEEEDQANLARAEKDSSGPVSPKTPKQRRPSRDSQGTETSNKSKKNRRPSRDSKGSAKSSK